MLAIYHATPPSSKSGRAMGVVGVHLPRLFFVLGLERPGDRSFRRGETIVLPVPAAARPQTVGLCRGPVIQSALAKDFGRGRHEFAKRTQARKSLGTRSAVGGLEVNHVEALFALAKRLELSTGELALPLENGFPSRRLYSVEPARHFLAGTELSQMVAGDSTKARAGNVCFRRPSGGRARRRRPGSSFENRPTYPR